MQATTRFGQLTCIVATFVCCANANTAWRALANMRTPILLVLVALLVLALGMAAQAGPLAYATCQTGCNVACGVCYAGFGVVVGVGSVPVCNVGLGACMATLCAPALLAPTP